jgi:hypothetical protein
MTSQPEIFLSDLTPEAQRKVLRFLKIKDAREANLDVFVCSSCPSLNQKKVDFSHF